MDRKKSWHAAPFVACLVAMLAIVFTPAFQSTASPPGVTNDAQYTAPATDTGQVVVATDKNSTGADIANITGSVNVTDSIVNRAISTVAYVYSGIVANDTAPPGFIYYAAQNIVAPTPSEPNTVKEVGDVICHYLTGAFANVKDSVYCVVDYPLLC